MIGTRLLDSLGRGELLVPYLEKSILSDNWPDHYIVEVDSGPYRGLGDKYFHPSSECLPSAKALYEAKAPAYGLGEVKPQHRSMGLEMAASIGKTYHAILQTQLIQAGLAKPENIEREVHNHEVYGRGYVDGIIDHPSGETFLLDIKTKTSSTFMRMSAPQKEWVYQMNAYMHWLGLKRCIILMVQTEYPYRMKEFIIKSTPELLDPVYEKWAWVTHLLENELPFREKGN